jgi:RimJ/RimL family protein N-acetyltransferase
MHVFLETERLILRRFTENDADALFELYDDAAVMKYLNGGRPADRTEIVTLDLPAFLGYYERFPGYGFWAAIEKPTGDFLGWFHFRPRPEDPPDEPELGYRLHQAAWGKGYGTEGSAALIAHGFTELGVRRVTAGTMVVNQRSRRVMEKLGMTLVRTYFEDFPEHELAPGAEQGEVEYAITREEWHAQEVSEGHHEGV